MRNYRYVAGVVGGVVAAAMTAACSGGDTGASTDSSASAISGYDHNNDQDGHGRQTLRNNRPFPNPAGFAATYTTSPDGKVDLTGPFFQSLGTNGRSCGSCHQPGDGWTVIPSHIRERFEETGGRDPIFRTNDGSNSPEADVSTVAARRNAYSMLLTRGLIRVSNPVPASAAAAGGFTLVSVDDPYGHSTAADISTFRRPLPSANIAALSTIMWDGRETQVHAAPSSVGFTDCTKAPTAPKCFAPIDTDLEKQSNDATLGHAQAMIPGLTLGQQTEIVAFERTLFIAQVWDNDAHSLTAHGAKGGPEAVSNDTFYFGINDVLSGDYITGAPFTATVFDEYSAWSGLRHGEENEARASVARGEDLFNNKDISITGVKGINDDFAVPVFPGHCTTCHDTPHGGNHSIPAPLDIGLTGDHPEAMPRTADMPSYTFRSNDNPAVTFTTTDPGRGLITGKFKDLGRFKGPVLRGVASRAPFFHNGSAATLEDAVTFYDKRFTIGLTAREKADISNFLKTL